MTWTCFLARKPGLSTISVSDGWPDNWNHVLMLCLENIVPVKEDLSAPRVQVNILDGACIINMLRPGTAKTFQADVLVPYVTSQLQHVDRLDIVWDLYMADSLKAGRHSQQERKRA